MIKVIRAKELSEAFAMLAEEHNNPVVVWKTSADFPKNDYQAYEVDAKQSDMPQLKKVNVEAWADKDNPLEFTAAKEGESGDIDVVVFG